jgi:hypothetical protein
LPSLSLRLLCCAQDGRALLALCGLVRPSLSAYAAADDEAPARSSSEDGLFLLAGPARLPDDPEVLRSLGLALSAAGGNGRPWARARLQRPRPCTPTPPGRGPLASPKGDHPTRADPSADPSYRPRKQAGRTPRPCERSALEARGGSQAFSSSATTSPSYLASPPLLSPAELASSRPLSFACPPPASNPSDTSQQPPGPPSPYRLTMPGLKKTTINASYLCVLPFDERTTPSTEAFWCDCCCVCPDD